MSVNIEVAAELRDLARHLESPGVVITDLKRFAASDGTGYVRRQVLLDYMDPDPEGDRS